MSQSTCQLQITQTAWQGEAKWRCFANVWTAGTKNVTQIPNNLSAAFGFFGHHWYTKKIEKSGGKRLVYWWRVKQATSSFLPVCTEVLIAQLRLHLLNLWPRPLKELLFNEVGYDRKWARGIQGVYMPISWSLLWGKSQVGSIGSTEQYVVWDAFSMRGG